MRITGKSMKKGLAVFLSVCMVTGSVQVSGKTTALGAEKEGKREASVLEFDPLKLREAVEEAAKSTVLVDPPQVIGTASASDVTAGGFTMASFELADAEKLLKEGTELPQNTNLRIFLTPQWSGIDDEKGDYTLTGSENLTFMIENTSSDKKAYQLLFGNKLTDIIEVESKGELLKEYGETEIYDDLVPGVGGPVSGGGAGGGGSTQAPEETTVGSPEQLPVLPEVPSEGETNPPQEGAEGSEDNTDETETETEDQEEGSEDSEENTDETDKDDSTEAGSDEGEENGSGTGSENENNPDTGKDNNENSGNPGDTENGSTDENTYGNEDAGEAGNGNAGEVNNGNTGEAGNGNSDNTSTGSSDSNEAGTSEENSQSDTPDSDVSIISRAVDFFTGTITSYAEVRTASDNDADKETNAPAQLPADDAEVPTQLPAEETTKTELPWSDIKPATPSDSEVEVATDNDAKDTRDFVSPLNEDEYVRLVPVSVSESTLINKELSKTDAKEKNENVAAVLFMMDEPENDDETPNKKNTSAVGMVTLAMNEIMPLANDNNGNDVFTINMYDYGPAEKGQEHTNKYFEDNNLNIEFGSTGDASTPYNCWRYNTWSGNRYITVYPNITQGLPTMMDGENRVLDFDVLYPETDQTSTISEWGGIFTGWQDVTRPAVKVYNNVVSDESDPFLQLDDEGYWNYDSEQYGASLSADGTTLSRIGDNGGFWPFGVDSYYFGMTVDFDFYKPADGRYNNQDMIYSFSGDDDVWVYLSDAEGNNETLALDLGGIHDRVNGEINFATGVITYYFGDSGCKGSASPLINNIDSSKIEGTGGNQKAYAYLYSEEDVPVNERGKYFTFLNFPKDAGTYRLSFKYLERGAGESNCMLRFNLPVIQKGALSLSKQISANTEDLGDYQSQDYNFNLVYVEGQNSLDELVTHYNTGSDASGSVQIESNITVKGSSSQIVADLFDAESTYYFYVEETGTNVGGSIGWDVSAPIAENVGDLTPQETKTPNIYKVENGAGVSVLCTNIFGELEPEIAKRAWKDFGVTDRGEYDVTLQVKGDEITTTSEQRGAANVVFVYDTSGSMAGEMEGVITEIETLVNALDTNSYVSLVSFADKGIGWDEEGYTYYDNSNDASYYNNVSAGWVSLATEKERLTNILNYEKNRTPTGGTHSAAGFLGAFHRLNDLPDEAKDNPVFVIYLTDGEPTYGLLSYTDNWGRTRGRLYDANNNSYNEDECIQAAQYVLGKVANHSTEPSVYTIAYNKSNLNTSWLAPKSDSNPNGSDGITKGYSANGTDELKKILEEIKNSIPVTERIENPVVHDVIDLENVDLTGSVEESTTPIPELYVLDGTISGTVEGSRPSIPTAEKGTLLTATLNSERTGVVYTYPGDETATPIATYEFNSHTITWYVGRNAGSDANSLGNATRTLSYKVIAKNQTEDPVHTGDSGTGTHAGEPGYRSNENAYLTFDGQDGDYIFKHPVVKPVASSLTISKNVEGLDSTTEGKGTYTFELKFDDGKQYGLPEGAVWDEGEKTYTFTLGDDDSIVFDNVPTGIRYTITETGEAEGSTRNNDYYLSEIEVAGTGTIANNTGDEVEPTELKTTGEIVAARSTAVFTNTFAEYPSIILRKVVEGSPDAVPSNPDKKFSFIIDPSNYLVGEEDGTIEVAASSNAKIKIDPKYTGIFTITEAANDVEEAWNTTVSKNDAEAVTGSGIEDVRAGDTITFTNYYYKHDIVLEKQVSLKDGETNPVPDAQYKFDVKLAVENGKELTATDIQLSNEQTVVIQPDPVVANQYQFSVMLKAGETVTIENLPKWVTSYEISEDLSGTTGIENSNYEPDIESVTLDGEVVADKIAEDNFDKSADQKPKVVITNKFKPAMGKLMIVKNLQAGESNAEAVKAEENLAFEFKITNTQTGKSSYVVVRVDEGNSTGWTEITVPAGAYTVEEITSLGYQAVSENPQTVIVISGDELGEDATATFANYKTSDGYFSDTSTTVNKVTKEGFEQQDILADASFLSRLFSTGKKEDGDEQ